MNPRIPILGALVAALTAAAPAIADITPPPPVGWALRQNDPEPFGTPPSTTTIQFDAAQAAHVVLTVLDSSMTVMERALVNSDLAAGTFSVVWDGRDDQGNALFPGRWPYLLTAFDSNGDTLFSAFRVATMLAAVVDTVPSSWSLEQNDPNPFCGETRIRLTVPRPANLRLEVLNGSNGSVVRTLLNGNYAAGVHAVIWDGRDDQGTTLSDGEWPYRLVARDSANNEFLIGPHTATIACGTPRCLLGSWAHEVGDCDARVGPGQPDSVTFMVTRGCRWPVCRASSRSIPRARW